MTLSRLEALERSSEAADVVFMDEDTFRAFYERTARGVWAYLARISGDRQLADDLLQETFYRFYRLGATHENETHRRNSLYLIATNLVRDAARRNRNRTSIALPEEDEADTLRAQDDVGGRAEGRTDLARAMARLDPRQREMLWLAYAQGASHAEIAETLGLRAASIKTLLFRARRTVAKFLGGSHV
ncbi:MAG TPA: RNA polymerase sigma factor [Thermoanaerobaculia bacterium]|nr:RNA polymerase sigma factor [Thermoanaerobaculia bacterium]